MRAYIRKNYFFKKVSRLQSNGYSVGQFTLLDTGKSIKPNILVALWHIKLKNDKHSPR